VLKLENICQSFHNDDIETRALDAISLEIKVGEFVAITGPSGSGKSTLLQILGLLESPSGGSYQFFGEEVARLPESRLSSLRRGAIGFVFQNFNLIEDLTAVQNVEVALMYGGIKSIDRKRLANEALERVSMSHRANNRPQQLSGGQQQRVAIARAIVGSPKLILADEPTGNLDSLNGETVMDLLRSAVDRGTTVIMVSHSLAHAAQAKRTINLLDGRVLSETRVSL